MNIKLNKNFKELKNGDYCLIYIEAEEMNFFEFGYWVEDVSILDKYIHIEGGGNGFYYYTENLYGEMYKKCEKVLGFIKLEDIEVN